MIVVNAACMVSDRNSQPSPESAVRCHACAPWYTVQRVLLPSSNERTS